MNLLVESADFSILRLIYIEESSDAHAVLHDALPGYILRVMMSTDAFTEIRIMIG